MPLRYRFYSLLVSLKPIRLPVASKTMATSTILPSERCLRALAQGTVNKSLGTQKGLKESKGIVIVLHDLSLAARYCHRIYLMHEGRIVMSGNPKEVLTPENLKKVYGITAKYGYEDDDFYVVPWDRLEKGSIKSQTHTVT